MLDWGSVADWVAAIGTVGAVSLAVRQIRLGTALAAQNVAHQFWIEYLRLGLQHPELGEAEFAKEHFAFGSYEELVKGRSVDSQRYLWFLSVMLETCESIMNNRPSRFWVDTVNVNLKYHQGALLELWPEERKYYSVALNEAVKNAVPELA